MKKILLLLALPFTLAAAERPPAVPLVTNDPYFSIWSMSDRLNMDSTRHWTGKVQALHSLARIDGVTYRLMGAGDRDDSSKPLEQRSVTVAPTQTTYEFEGAGVGISLVFTTPLLPHDLDVLSRPLTYVTWRARSLDGRPHPVQIYFEASTNLAVNNPAEQPVNWARMKTKGLSVLRVGSREQPMLEKSGDDLRIDWGFLYLAAVEGPEVHMAANDRSLTRAGFGSNGSVNEEDAFAQQDPRNRYNPVRNPVLAMSHDLGQVGATPVSSYVMLAYDDLYSLEYLNRRVRPYWRRNGAEASDLLHDAAADYQGLMSKCAAFDRDLMADLTREGGKEYAGISALAYRQSIAAHKLAVDADGMLL
ncbi:MAG TPA: DUF5127 domain-containing protein, partial [Bryobacteraceae bacterium]